jgi:hypothetical protein
MFFTITFATNTNALDFSADIVTEDVFFLKPKIKMEGI